MESGLERDDSTEKEEDLEDDQRALLNLERNIANIERSMSASQLEQADYPGRRKGVSLFIFVKSKLFCVHKTIDIKHCLSTNHPGYCKGEINKY